MAPRKESHPQQGKTGIEWKEGLGDAHAGQLKGTCVLGICFQRVETSSLIGELPSGHLYTLTQS